MYIDPTLYEKYSKEKVEEAIAFLNYKNPTQMPKEEIEGVPTLFVFRHGQTTDNQEMVFCGWRDPDLTEEGILGAKILADKLKDKKIHLLVASDQQRSIKTMQLAIALNPMCKNLEIIKDPRIKERSYGDLQGTSKLTMQLENPEQAKGYRRSYSITPPNGESLEMVIARVNPFIDEIVKQMKEFKMNVAVSCHGNSIRAFRQRFEKLSHDQTVNIESPLAKDYAAYAIK